MIQKLRFIFGLFLINKVLITVATWIGLSGQHPHWTWSRTVSELFVGNYNRWDAVLYEEIAVHGYSHQYLAAFFPLFPSLMHFLSPFTGHSATMAGILIANICFLLLMYVMYELFAVDYPVHDVRRMLLLLAVFPTSFYFSAPYAEALFLLFCVTAVYAMRKQRWWMAGVAGLGATLTRNVGVFLAIPYLLELFKVTSFSQILPFHPSKRALRQIVWVCLIPAGIFIYMAYLNIRFHDPLAFSHAQKLWRREYHDPLWTVVVGLHSYSRYIFHPDFKWHMFGYALTNSLFVIGMIVVLVISSLKMRLSYWVLMLYSFLIPLTAPEVGTGVSDYFMSISRFTLVIFPLYMVLYRFIGGRKWLYLGTVCLFSGLLMTYVYIWTTNMGFIA